MAKNRTRTFFWHNSVDNFWHYSPNNFWYPLWLGLRLLNAWLLAPSCGYFLALFLGYDHPYGRLESGLMYCLHLLLWSHFCRVGTRFFIFSDFCTILHFCRSPFGHTVHRVVKSDDKIWTLAPLLRFSKFPLQSNMCDAVPFGLVNYFHFLCDREW